MKETLSLTLQKDEVSFLSEMVKSGRFANRAKVIRTGLRLLEDYEYHQKAKRLQVLIAQGDADIKAGRMDLICHSQSISGCFKRKIVIKPFRLVVTDKLFSLAKCGINDQTRGYSQIPLSFHLLAFHRPNLNNIKPFRVFVFP